MWAALWKFFGAWMGVATPQRADFESLTAMLEKLNDRLNAKLEAAEKRMEARERHWEQKEAAWNVKMGKLTTICRDCRRANARCEEQRKSDLERLANAEARILELERHQV